MFCLDMVCAVIASACTLAIPLCVRYITKDILAVNGPDTLSQVYIMGGVMLALVAVHTACHAFIDYKGHVMGALMEGDMRKELFEHYQKLSFHFYDEQKTGQLMTRVTNDTYDLAELFHHGPEDILISLLNFTGAFIILLTINVPLTLVVVLFFLSWVHTRSISARR